MTTGFHHRHCLVIARNIYYKAKNAFERFYLIENGSQVCSPHLFQDLETIKDAQR